MKKMALITLNNLIMKNVSIFFFLVFLIISSSLLAQKFPDPEFSSRPYILQADFTLKNLERADAQIDMKVKGMGYGGVETYYTVFTPASDVRLSKSALPKFIIKIEGNLDPSELVALSLGTAKKSRRRFLQGSMGMTGKARDVSDAYLKLEFKKIRNDIYEIILPKDIQAGEYAFMPISSNSQVTPANTKVKLSCFGID
jgi:hypothetical protein